ncbi:TPA: hypothetical protein L7Z86_000764 [Klebsiella quasipneumoniae subsp. similipneumoniae]|nr:hypothetical protein [Klebsiella quasipneumoniae subsp. similipneumoniae]
MAEVPLPTPTQAPVPSTDIRNAVFAGAKLDEEVTGTGEFYTDRLGVKRLTNTGRNNQFDAAQMDRANRFEQFLLSSGYVFLGDYEDGPFQFSARNQYIRYDTQYYRLNAATDVGFTTTGTDATSFANDVTHFVLMDGDTLRQNLGSEEEGLGDTLVTHVKETKAWSLRAYLNGSIQYVTPFLFGGVGGSTTVDNNQPIQDMLAFAKLFGFGVDLRGGPWRITETADFLGIYSVLSNWSGRFLVDSTNFTAAHAANYVLTFGNPDTAYGSDRATYVNVNGTLGIVSDNRTNELNGVFFKGSHFKVDYVRVYNLNGAGVMLSAAWDSVFQSFSVELCGNLTSYQFHISSGGDTSNCLTINRIQSERAYHKCLSIAAIRSVINEIHAERTAVLTTDDGTTVLESGLTYTNVTITLGTGSVINQMIHDCLTSGTAPDGTAIAATKSSMVLNVDYSKVIGVNATGSVVSTSLARDASFDTCQFLDWYFLSSTANVIGNNVSNPRIFGTLYPSVGTTFIGGHYKSIRPRYNAQSLTFNGPAFITDLGFPANIVGDIFFNYCQFDVTLSIGDTKAPSGNTGSSTVGEARSPVTFNHCNIMGSVVGSYQSRAVINGGRVGTVNLVSRAAIELYDVKGGSFNYTGDRGFITRGCRFDAVAAWDVPSHINYPIGTLTERMGAATGVTNIYRCSNQSTPTWVAIA